MAGNERALGYDLLADPRPEVPDGVRRALETDSVVITGPILLVQGGEGLLVRRRLAPRRGFPDVVAVILDVPAIVAEGGVPDRRTGLLLEVRDRAGHWFGGDTIPRDAEPEQIAVRSARLGVALRAGRMGTWELDVVADRMTFDENGASIVGRSL